MSAKKKAVRASFRAGVFARDDNKCRVCGWNKYPDCLDAHHIVNRNNLPAGGYVVANGVILCPIHHHDAETGLISAYKLYELINSSHEEALEASKELE